MRRRRVDLEGVIRERFGVVHHERSVSRLPHTLGFSHMSARPRHPAQDPAMLETFEKTSRARRALRSPEPNPTENVWQYLRQTFLSNRVFETYDAIIDAACDACNHLVQQPDRITSTVRREWAATGLNQ